MEWSNFSLEKRGLFQLGEFAGVDALWNEDPGNPQIEEGRLRDFVDYYSEQFFPTECVRRLACEMGANFPQLKHAFEW